MGIFSFFRRKNQKEETAGEIIEEPTNIEYANVLNWFDKNMGDRLKNAEVRHAKLLKKTKEEFSAIMKSATELENVQFESGDKTYTAANMVKDTFVKKTYSSLQSVQFPNEMAYSLLKDFHDKSTRAIGEIKSMSPKQMILLSRYFKQESSKVMEDLNHIERQLKLISDFLNNEGKIIQAHQNISKTSKEQELFIRQIKDLSKKEEGIAKEIQGLELNQKQIQEKMKDIENGEEYGRLLSLKNSINSLKQKANEIEKAINDAINSIKRPIKKLEYETKKDYLKGTKNPFREIILEGRENVIKKTLLDVLEHSKKGSIILKQKEKEKITSLLGKEKEISGYREEYKAIIAKIHEAEKSIKSEFSGLFDAKNSLENSLDKNKEKTKFLISQKVLISDEIKSLRENVYNEKESMEKLILESTGKAININFNI